jgi:hypothetical protein
VKIDRMTDEPDQRPNDRTLARQNRLRDALRENLKRRKSQARGRSDPAAALAGQEPAQGPNAAAPSGQDEST